MRAVAIAILAFLVLVAAPVHAGTLRAKVGRRVPGKVKALGRQARERAETAAGRAAFHLIFGKRGSYAGRGTHSAPRSSPQAPASGRSERGSRKASIGGSSRGIVIEIR